MAYTTEDLDAVDEAILKLVKGERIVRVSMSEGRSVEYAQADLRKLREIRAEIAPLVTGRPRYLLTTTRKGL